jgi:hypothetical protein
MPPFEQFPVGISVSALGDFDAEFFAESSRSTSFTSSTRRRSYDDGDYSTSTSEKIRSAVPIPAFLPYFDTLQTAGETAEMRDAYRRMLAEPYVKSAFMRKVMAVASSELSVRPPKSKRKSQRHQKAAEFIDWNLKHGLHEGIPGMVWDIFSGGLIDGVSVCEKIVGPVEESGPWKGKRRLARLKAKDVNQDLVLEIDAFKNITGIRGLRYNGGEVFNPKDFVIYTHLGLYENPVGMSDFRAAYRAYWLLDTVWKLRALAIDKRSMPIIVGEWADPKAQSKLETALAKIRYQNWLSVPKDTQLQAFDIAGQSHQIFSEAVRDLREEVTTSILWAILQTMTSPNQRGSSDVHKDTADLAAWHLVSALCHLLNDHENGIIPWLVDLNFSGIDEYPVASAGGVDDRELTESVRVDESLQRIVQPLGLQLDREELEDRYGRKFVEAQQAGGGMGPDGQPIPGQPMPGQPMGGNPAMPGDPNGQQPDGMPMEDYDLGQAGGMPPAPGGDPEGFIYDQSNDGEDQEEKAKLIAEIMKGWLGGGKDEEGADEGEWQETEGEGEGEEPEAFNAQDWVHTKGPRSSRLWVNSKTGQKVYADTNPGGDGRQPAQPDQPKQAASDDAKGGKQSSAAKKLSAKTSSVLKTHQSEAKARGEAAVAKIGGDTAAHAKRLQKALDDAEVTVNFSPSASAAGIFGSGSLKTSFGGTKKNDAGYLGMRRKVESSVLGATDVPDEERPIYAAVNWGGRSRNGAAPVYGNACLVLKKDAIKDRATLTARDTWGLRDASTTGTMADPLAALAANRRALRAAGIEHDAGHDAYTEVQVWGGEFPLTKEAVEEIRIPASETIGPHADVMRQFSERTGVPLTVFHDDTGEALDFETARTLATNQANAAAKNKGLLSKVRKFIGFSEDDGEEQDWAVLVFAEEDWSRQPGPRSKRRWVHVKTGQVKYADENPGKGKGRKNSPEDKASRLSSAKDLVGRMLSGDMQARDDVAKALNELTIPQLKELKATNNITATGRKAEMVAAIVQAVKERSVEAAKLKDAPGRPSASDDLVRSIAGGKTVSGAELVKAARKAGVDLSDAEKQAVSGMQQVSDKFTVGAGDAKLAKAVYNRVAKAGSKPQETKGESLASIIKKRGGISRAKLGDDWNIGEDFAQAGLLGLFSKSGGAGLDDIAQSLAEEGHIKVPEGRNADDYLMELLQNKATSLHADMGKQLEAEQAKYYEELENAKQHADESEVEAAVRAGEEAGRAEGEAWEAGEALGGMADEEGAGGEVGDFEFGAASSRVEPDEEPDAVIGKANVGGQEISFIPNASAMSSGGYRTLMVDVGKVEEAWKKADEKIGYYLPKERKDGPYYGQSEKLGGRKAFKEFLKTGKPVQASRGTLDRNGLSLEDGRHRFAVMRDMGATQVAMSVPVDQFKEIQQKYGADDEPVWGLLEADDPTDADFEMEIDRKAESQKEKNRQHHKVIRTIQKWSTFSEPDWAEIFNEGPREGERNSSGLVFHNHRWRRDEPHGQAKAAVEARQRREQYAASKKTVVKAIMKHAKAVGGLAAEVHGEFKKLVANQVNRLPKPIAEPLKKLHAAYGATFTAAHAAVKQVAKARGLSDEQVANIAWYTSAADYVVAYGVGFAASTIGLGFVAKKLGGFLPLGSLAYLSVSAAKNPVATLKAIHGLVSSAMGGSAATFAEADNEAFRHEFVEWLLSVPDADMAAGCFMVAMDRTKGDWRQAMSIARRAIWADSSKALADYYADLWNGIESHGGTVSEEQIDAADAELLNTPWRLSNDNDKWAVIRVDDADTFAEEDWRKEPGPRSQRRWVHVKSGLVRYSDENPGRTKDDRNKARRERGTVDTAKLREQLKPHAATELAEPQKKRAKRILAALKAHHGELTHHRIEELIGDLQKGHDAADNETNRAWFAQQLKMAEGMLDALGDAPEIAKPEPVGAVPETMTFDDAPSSPAAKAAEEAEAKDESPREVAAAITQAETSEYEFARDSAVPNFGEDLKGAARHTANEWRGLAQAEADGTAAAMMTRDTLLKIEPHELMATITNTTAVPHLVAHLAINAFPKEPGEYPKNYHLYTWNRGPQAGQKLPPPTAPDKLRQQYLDAYKNVRDFASSQAITTKDHKEAIQNIRKHVGGIIAKHRENDPYNPVANGLVDLHERLEVPIWGRPRKNDILGRMEDFMGRVIAKYGKNVSVEMLDKIKSHVEDVIEGGSFNKTFGASGSGPKRFNPSDAYVNHAERKGGRVIDAATVEAGRAFLLDNLKLRGVQWGNYVTDDERQHHLTKTAEAFADLADATGFPDDAISLGGKLGLAIGARGKAGARAHYESDSQVINLTRAKGVGSLAHEWGHGLDNYLSDFKSFSSERVQDGPVGETMKAVRKAMVDSGFKSRLVSEVRQRIRDGVLPKNALEYWASSTEMFARTFERHIQDKLHSQGRENTYLTGLHKTGHPLWPTKQESEKMAPHFEALFAAIRQKHFQKEPNR